MPSSSGWLAAVVVSGGKQYRVAPGDRILVDRLAAAPGSEVALERVLFLQEEGGLKVGTPALDGVAVAARVVAHTRGPKIDVLRYKSKKRVRVHRGARADLTALEILAAPQGTAVKAGQEGEAGTAPRRRSSRSAAAKAPAAPPEGAPSAKAPARPRRVPAEPASAAGEKAEPKPRRGRAGGPPQEDGDGA